MVLGDASIAEYKLIALSMHKYIHSLTLNTPFKHLYFAVMVHVSPSSAFKHWTRCSEHDCQGLLSCNRDLTSIQILHSYAKNLIDSAFCVVFTINTMLLIVAQSLRVLEHTVCKKSLNAPLAGEIQSEGVHSLVEELVPVKILFHDQHDLSCERCVQLANKDLDREPHNVTTKTGNNNLC